MECTLCHKDIKNYDERFNRFKIDENSSADICRDCSDKIIQWQGSIIRELFPTSASKKASKRNNYWI